MGFTDGDPVAPVAIAPLFNLLPDHPEWLRWQRHYLANPDTYPATGYAPIAEGKPPEIQRAIAPAQSTTGQFQRLGPQEYQLSTPGQTWQLVTLWADLDRQLRGASTTGLAASLPTRFSHPDASIDGVLC